MKQQDIIGQLFNRFAQTQVLVVGDVMVDTYLWGKSDRMSPEAPVPVVDIVSTEHRLGGAANVALNLAALGAHVTLCSVTGDDREAVLIQQLLAQYKLDNTALIKSPNRPTTVKTRLMNGNKQVARFDREITTDLTEQGEKRLIQLVANRIKGQKPDVVVFQDYNKGVLTQKVIDSIISACAKYHIPTAVDPKKKRFFAYKGVDLFKPNLKEVKEALGIEIDKGKKKQLQSASASMREKLKNMLTLITLSEGGVFVDDGDESIIYPAIKRSIVDVSGAGDTVISIAALALAQGLDKSMIAQLSNIAGGLVCEQVGVVPIDKSRFLAECKQLLFK